MVKLLEFKIVTFSYSNHEINVYVHVIFHTECHFSGTTDFNTLPTIIRIDWN